MRETVLEAVLRSADAPSEAQRNRFAAFLKKQYGQEVPLRWEQDPALEKGFRMEVGADLYDWSLEGRLRQFRERLEQLNPAGVSVIPLMREAVRNWQPDVAPEEVGSVLTVGDENRHRQRIGTRGLRRNSAIFLRREGHGAGSAAGSCRLHPVRRQ